MLSPAVRKIQNQGTAVMCALITMVIIVTVLGSLFPGSDDAYYNEDIEGVPRVEVVIRTPGQDDVTISAPWSKDGGSQLDMVNAILQRGGVSVFPRDISDSVPQDLKNLLTKPTSLTAEESETVLQEFQLSMAEIIGYTRLAGRDPQIPGGGAFETTPAAGPNGVQLPYPQVQDYPDPAGADQRFEEMHVNQLTPQSGNGEGTDQVMQVVKGTFVWFQALDFETFGETAPVAQVKVIAGAGRPWAMVYPGRNPHGGGIYFPVRVIAQIVGNDGWSSFYQAQVPTLMANPFLPFSN